MVTVREGRVPDDVESCAAIWVAALAARDGTVDAQTMAQRVRESFARPLVRFGVATGGRSGFVTVESGRADPREAYLHYLAVDPVGTEAGVGRALMEDAVSHASSAGFERLALEVRTDNTRAIGLYERLGFVQDGPATEHPTAGYLMQPYALTLR